MPQVDAEDEPTVIITGWVTRDITTPPLVEREVGPTYAVAPDDDGSLAGGALGTAEPSRAHVGWRLAASAAVAALVTAAILALR